MEFVDLPLILEKESVLFEDYSYIQCWHDIAHAQFQHARKNPPFALSDREAEEREVHRLSHYVWRHAVELHIIYTYVPEHNDHFMLSSWHLGSIAYSAVIHFFLRLSLALIFCTLLYWCSLWLLLWQPSFALTCMQAAAATLAIYNWEREMEIERSFSCCWGELYVHGKLAAATQSSS